MIPLNHSYKRKLLILSAVAVVFGTGLIFIPHKKADAPSDHGQPGNMDNKKEKCALESCHGLDNLVCGKNAPEVCTEEYQLGDSCRRFFQCAVWNGKCQDIKSNKFDECKNCTEKCEEQYEKETEKAFECERQCFLKLNETESPELE